MKTPTPAQVRTYNAAFYRLRREIRRFCRIAKKTSPAPVRRISYVAEKHLNETRLSVRHFAPEKRGA